MPVKYRNRVKDNKRLHGIYHGVKKRCYNKNCKRYKDYGGRGIVMCDEWLDSDVGFDNFCDWAKSHGYEDNLTIERVDVDGNYCPENCIWITRIEQARNKRDTIRVTYNGIEKPLIAWCEELGLCYDSTHERIKDLGWSVERAFETPSQLDTSFAKKCKEHGINPGTARDRIVKFGWSYEDALNTPTRGRGSNSKTYRPEQFGYAECKICGKKFLKNSTKQIYCGEKCRSISKRTSYRKTGMVVDWRKNKVEVV